jgi:hypothetical protein
MPRPSPRNALASNGPFDDDVRRNPENNHRRTNEHRPASSRMGGAGAELRHAREHRGRRQRAGKEPPQPYVAFPQ